MATISAPVEHKVILSGVSWETYERLLAEHLETSGTHFIYDQGSLEIMVLSSRHEQPNRILAYLVQVLSEEFGINVIPVGSMTFKREKLQKGFEPDSAYYIAHAAEVQGRYVDPLEDPPPDLMIEVDITSPSLPRLPIYAAFGVPEVWRYDGKRVAFHMLETTGRYVEIPGSLAFPALTSETATQFLLDGQRLPSTQWARQVRDWARQQR